MKRWIHAREKYVFGMANLIPEKTGVPVDIWSDHKGCERSVSHRGTPRAKVGYQGKEISVSIEKEPRILAPKFRKFSKEVMKNLESGIKYIGRNYDLFLKHYMDKKNEFDDEALFNALRERSEYK